MNDLLFEMRMKFIKKRLQKETSAKKKSRLFLDFHEISLLNISIPQCANIIIIFFHKKSGIGGGCNLPKLKFGIKAYFYMIDCLKCE